MNDLSWLLYLANISGRVSHTAGFLAMLLGIASVGMLIYFIASGSSRYEDDQRAHTMIGKVLKRVIPAFVLCALLAILFPSQKTVYLIAASEAGETVATSETGKKALAAINRYLDDIGKEDKE